MPKYRVKETVEIIYEVEADTPEDAVDYISEGGTDVRVLCPVAESVETTDVELA